MAILKIKTDKVVFTSEKREGTLTYIIETEIKVIGENETIKITSSNFLDGDGPIDPYYTAVHLHRLTTLEEVIDEIMEREAFYELKIQSQETLQDWHNGNSGDCEECEECVECEECEECEKTDDIIWEGKFNGHEPLIINKKLFRNYQRYAISYKTKEHFDFETNTQNINVMGDRFKLVKTGGETSWKTDHKWYNVLGILSNRETKEHITHYFYKDGNTDEIVFCMDHAGMVSGNHTGEHTYVEIKPTTEFEIRSDNENSTEEIIIKEV